MSSPVHAAHDVTKETVYRLWEGWSYVEDICTLTAVRCWQIECSQQTMQFSEKHGASWAFFLSLSLLSKNTVNWKDYIASLIDEWMNECGELVEWQWQGEYELLREKPVPLPLCPPQIPHELAWDWTWPPRKQKGMWFPVPRHSPNEFSTYKLRVKLSCTELYCTVHATKGEWVCSSSHS